jgi:hypothetical protein
MRKAEVEASGEQIIVSDMTVQQLVQEYIEIYGVVKWGLSTYTNRKNLCKNYILPYIGNMKLKSITPRSMDKYFRDMQEVEHLSQKKDEHKTLSARTINEIHKVLKSMFNQVVKWKCMNSNPVLKAILPAYQAEERAIWTRDEYLEALTKCDDALLKLSLHLAVSTTMRNGEILGLTWDV